MLAQNTPTTERAEPTFVCDCDKGARSACQGESFFKEHEGKRYCVLHYPDTDKLEEFWTTLERKLDARDFDFRDVWFPEEVSFVNVEFSGDAHFYNATFSEDANFNEAIFRGDANFYKTTFSENAEFSEATFSGNAVFSEATFSGNAEFNKATFSEDANFYKTTFSEDAEFNEVTFSMHPIFTKTTFSGDANFNEATFSLGASFSEATFSGGANFNKATFSAVASFSEATFSADANFNKATFTWNAEFSEAIFSGNAEFNKATFSADANFHKATFKGYTKFAGSKGTKTFGEQARLNIQFTNIEKPERVSFHTVYLRPPWFINTDCRRFEFTDCGWNFGLKEELESTSKARIDAPHRLLAITYRQLADNAEANHRYLEASQFRYNAFEARRIERYRGFVPWRLDWWYWLASGYGESVGRAFILFVALLALFAVGYGRGGFDQGNKATSPGVTQAAIQPDTVGKPLDWKDAIIYSFNVVILQKPKPEPLTRTAKLLVSLETVLGPAQAALLALAVRRRFMR